MSETKADFARRERARRILARRRIIPFAQYTDPEMAATYSARHLGLIGRFLERAEDGSLWADVPGDGVRIAIITTPPRHWKSSLVSRKFPAWFVGKRKTEKKPYQVITASYGASLAEANNRAVLEMIDENPLYANVFPGLQLSRKSRSNAEWALEGEAFPAAVAAGTGGGLTGQGADCFIIDDPIKDRADANSAAARNRLWDWWEFVARTRANPGGFFIIVMTRWHTDDLVGRLLARAEERIVMLRLPALAETERERLAAVDMGLPYDEADPLGREVGEALWENRIPAVELRVTKKNTPMSFEALYQGRPTPSGGYLVHRDQVKILPAAPTTNIEWAWGTDWAITSKEAAPKGNSDPDYTVAALVGLWTPGEPGDVRIVIGYISRGQHNIHDARILVKNAALTMGPGIPIYAITGGNKIHIDTIALGGLRRDPDLLLWRKIKGLDIPGDKVTRAQPWLDRVHGGSVYVVAGSWNEAFFNELDGFPHGAFDDQIDGVSVGVHGHGLGKKPKKPAHSAPVAFYNNGGGPRRWP